MMRSRLAVVLVVILVAGLAGPANRASAQETRAQDDGFAIDRFEPAERGSRWFALESADWSGNLRPSVGLTLDYAHKPLVLYDPEGDEKNAIVKNQLFVHVGASLTVAERLRFGVSLPIALVNSGDTGSVGPVSFPAPDGIAVGDLRLGAAVRALGAPGSAFRLAFGLSVFVPTGSRGDYSGDGKIRILPQVLVGGTSGSLEYAARLGFHYRSLEDTLNGAALGSELGGGAALGVRLLDRKLLLGPELYFSTVVSDSDQTFDRRTTPLEALFGAHYDLSGGWRAGAGIGPGLTRGLGTPSFRIVAGLEWTMPAAPAPQDRDHDGVLDRDDDCPDVPGLRELRGCPPPPDRDGDGILDPEDACPDVPGVRTDDPKTNGCPPPPPPDRDGDGVLDSEDACPDVPGVRTNDPKTNGCPPDRDGDGVLDKDDACPDIPGPASSDPKTNGCPPVRIDRETQQILILEQIKFKTDSAIILPESETILLGLREILSGHPEILKVRIEGHTDNQGSAKHNKGLSKRRAQSVVKWLTKSGISRKRLYGVGFGMARPIDSNDTPEGRQNNRRVEFHIEKQEAPSSEQPLEVKP